MTNTFTHSIGEIMHDLYVKQLVELYEEQTQRQLKDTEYKIIEMFKEWWVSRPADEYMFLTATLGASIPQQYANPLVDVIIKNGTPKDKYGKEILYATRDDLAYWKQRLGDEDFEGYFYFSFTEVFGDLLEQLWFPEE